MKQDYSYAYNNYYIKYAIFNLIKFRSNKLLTIVIYSISEYIQKVKTFIQQFGFLVLFIYYYYIFKLFLDNFIAFINKYYNSYKYLKFVISFCIRLFYSK